MFIFGNLLETIAKILNLVITLYLWVVIVRVILSWVNLNSNGQLVHFIYQVTEPVLSRVRQFLPPMGAFDFSPMIVILILYFLQNFVIRTLLRLAYSLH